MMILLSVYALGQKIVNINELTNSETLISMRRSLWIQISRHKVNYFEWIFLQSINDKTNYLFSCVFVYLSKSTNSLHWLMCVCLTYGRLQCNSLMYQWWDIGFFLCLTSGRTQLVVRHVLLTLDGGKFK